MSLNLWENDCYSAHDKLRFAVGEIQSLQAKLTELQNGYEMMEVVVAHNKAEYDELLTKLTEAERKLAEIYATEPVGYAQKGAMENTGYSYMHKEFKGSFPLIPLPTKEPT